MPLGSATAWSPIQSAASPKARSGLPWTRRVLTAPVRPSATAHTTLDPDLMVPELTIDAEINLKDVVASFYNIICQMEPFGPDNLRPMFLTRGVYNTGYSKVVKEKHLRFVVKQGLTTLTGIGFGLADKAPLLLSGLPVDLVYKIEENEWNGEKSLQLRVIDVRETGGPV